ncbi:hypothetical protein I6I18_05160 [Kytococcus sedentarius]|uniref:Uncharacterized protein n=1 Tax=Kytococcus sedentarius (strain ATCC 14392 / DSM 20547 / JCM 11482 / CCUG 33030 / NBRC 15357 / NCTC 11040 / CCM 314 / 541) TaxID=478801 RepID=C7NHZ5_KYTSD|nr:hypothetical protein [Kytococcus sedentarius]ACV06502.1 hypothetical protein Ksed_14770 [Kytococcus sedentarius DSM 20547]QQB64814.1 hypothetical protein I6I18_05160 [Kytococcus sedentarius]STX12074.1 Uncharacterised protein [Kytococcus sedentarius]
MQLTTDVQERRGTRWLVVRATPEAQDDTTVGSVEMAGRVAHIELPAQVGLPHPDVRALIALLCVVRGVSREFTLDHPVSPAFATGVEAATGWTVGREEVRARIEEFLEPMDAAEQRQVRQFDARPWWGSPEQVAAHARLQEVIARAKVQPRRQWRAEAGRARRYLARRLLRR